MSPIFMIFGTNDVIWGILRGSFPFPSKLYFPLQISIYSFTAAVIYQNQYIPLTLSVMLHGFQMSSDIHINWLSSLWIAILLIRDRKPQKTLILA